MFKILILNNIADAGLQEFPSDLYHVSNDITHPDAILVRSFDLHKYQIPSSVKVVGRAGAGVNNIPLPLLTQRGVPVLNTPGANANAVCELVLAGMLIASRQLNHALHYVKNLNCNEDELSSIIERDKKQFAGQELLGKTLGVVGLGSIGVKVANAAHALGMKVIGYDPQITINRAWELSSNVSQAKRLEDLLRVADYITFHVPLMPETEGMVSAKEFSYMKPSVVLLNFSRDGIIDQESLITSLKNKKIFKYVSDFPHQFLREYDSVISLPHLGASTKEAEENCAVMLARQVRAFLEHGAIGSTVNFPILDASVNNGYTRLAIVNANVPNMVAKISSTLGSAEFNIISLTNKSKDDIAYTLIDLDHDVNNNIIESLKGIKGVIQVRKIGIS